MNCQNELFELIFEELPEAVALALANRLLGRPIASRTANSPTFDEELEQLTISDEVVIRRPHVRLLCYGNTVYDVEVNFLIRDVNESARSRLASDLQQFAMKLIHPFGTFTFYAGLEPASDEDRRVFTGRNLGPLETI